MVAAAAPRISIVIATRGRTDKLLCLLSDLDLQRSPPAEMEVLVVDDGSPSDSSAQLQALDLRYNLKILRVSHGGPARARNRALEQARGEYVLFLNDDVRVAPDLIGAHLGTHARLAMPCAVLGTFQFTPALRQDLFCRVLEDCGLTHTRQLTPERFYDYRTFWTANLSLPRATLSLVGGFDADFVEPSNDDIELGLRLARELGLQVYFTSAARAEHDHLHTPTQWRQRNRMVGRTTLLLHLKHGNSDLSGLEDGGRISPARVRLSLEQLLEAAPVAEQRQATLEMLLERARSGPIEGRVELGEDGVFELPQSLEACLAVLIRQIGRYDQQMGLLEALDLHLRDGGTMRKS